MKKSKKVYQPVHDGLSSEQKYEVNFGLLKEYLKDNDMHISGELFKAAYWTMNALTIRHGTKAVAIKKAALKYGVTQVSLKAVIDDMGIVGTRAIEQRKQRSGEYGLSKMVKNRVLMDDLKEGKIG